MIDRHFHWRFLAYDDLVPTELELRLADALMAKGATDAEMQPFNDALNRRAVPQVTVDVIGYMDEGTALLAARDILARKHFGLRAVWECTSCGASEKTVEVMSRLADKA